VKLYNSGVRLKSILLIIEIDLGYIEEVHNNASFLMQQVHNMHFIATLFLKHTSKRIFMKNWLQDSI